MQTLQATRSNRIARISLIVLDAFLGLTAVAGGIVLLFGDTGNAPPLALLEGSPFRDYTIPGLVLLVIVGGSALAATVWMLRRHWLGAPSSAIAGLMIVCFETVEVWAIGTSPGIARTLQIFYFGLGILMIALAISLWMTKEEEDASEQASMNTERYNTL